jgi:hypothetical protein
MCWILCTYGVFGSEIPEKLAEEYNNIYGWGQGYYYVLGLRHTSPLSSVLGYLLNYCVALSMLRAGVGYHYMMVGTAKACTV